MRLRKLAPIVLLAALILAGCPNPPGGGDHTAPTALASLEQDSFLTIAEPILITFSEPMDTGSLLLGGDMAAESDGGTWTGTDVLTVAPAASWSAGAERTLTISARDLAGNLAPILTLALQVVEVYLHVSDDGSDTNDGCADHPMLSVQGAISRADTFYSTALIKVAGGEYEFDSNVASPGDGAVVLVEGICLRGGYDPADWSEWDPVAHETVLRDTNLDSTGSSAISAVNRAVYAPVGITSATRVEGFTLIGGGGDFNTVFWLAGSPIVRGNFIQAGVCPGHTAAGESSRGIICTNDGTPRIEGNSITGGSGGHHAYAVEMLDAHPNVVGNVLYGGAGYSSSWGISIQQDSEPLIADNLIHSGDATGMAFAIGCTTNADARIFNNTIYAIHRCLTIFSSAPDIRNNILMVFAGGCGIAEENVCSPRVENNLFSGCTVLYRDDNATDVLSLDGAVVTTAADPDLTLAGLGNVSGDPALADADGLDDNLATMMDNDWHLTAATALSVARGGQDLSAFFTDDRDGITRTVPWSMGAYER